MYEGEWLHDKRWGNGMLRLRICLIFPFILNIANENRYEGGWIDDKKNGKGKFFFQATNQVMEGVWIDDIAQMTAITDLGPRQEKTRSTCPIPKVRFFSAYFNHG